MATSSNMAFDGFLGRTGDYVTYILNGKVVRRRIGKSSKPATAKQKK